MYQKKLIMLAMFATLSLTGCDKIKAMTQKTVACNDPVVMELVEEQLQKNVLSATKTYLQFGNDNVDIGLIKEAVSHLKISLDDISNGQKDANSSKNLCTASLTIGLNKTLLERAEEVRKLQGELPIQDFAFRQDIDFIGTQVQHALSYSTTPTDSADKVIVALDDVSDMQDFIARIIVDASQQGDFMEFDIASATAAAQASETASAPAMQTASSVNGANANEKTAIGPAGTREMDEEPDVDSAAISGQELAKLQRAKAKAQAQMDFKRKEFNQLWNSASAEAQESLTDDQKQWVVERDEACTAEAQDAEPAEQEIVRMQCVARMLGERYYEVKEYFDNYEE